MLAVARRESRPGRNTPARRRPALMSRMVLLLVTLLLAAGLSVRPSHQQEVFLYAAPWQLLHDSQPALLRTHYDGFSTAFIRISDDVIRRKTQRDSLEDLQEVRWGPFFAGEFQSITRPRSGLSSSGGLFFVLSVNNPEPTVVEYTHKEVAYFDGTTVFDLPAPSTELLAAVAGTADREVILLGLIGDPDATRSVYLARLSGAGPLALPVSAPNAFLGPGLAVPGMHQSFYMSVGKDVVHIALESSMQVHVRSWPSSRTILALAATRLTSTQESCPDGADVIIVQKDGILAVLTCFTPTSIRDYVSVSLPSVLPLEGVRLLAPPVDAVSPNLAKFFYLIVPNATDPLHRVWMYSMESDTLAKRAVILPRGFNQPAGLQLARLHTSDRPTYPWYLVSGSTVLFDDKALGCEDDWTIRCEREDRFHELARGWACAPGQAMSPFVSDAHLCAGCVSRHYLERGPDPTDEAPFSHESHSCQACTDPNCLTCDQEDCLVCAGGFLNQVDVDSQRTTCVTACSMGFAPVSGTCQPVGQPRATVELTVPQPTQPEDLPDPMDMASMNESWLSLDLDADAVLISTRPSGPPTGVLLFSRYGDAFIQESPQDIQSDVPRVRQVSQLNLPIGTWLRSAAELGPLAFNGKATHRVMACDPAGELHMLRMTCNVAAACVVDSIQYSKSAGFYCSSMARVHANALVVRSNHAQVYVIRADPRSMELIIQPVEATGVAVLPVHTSLGLRAAPGLGDWFVWTTMWQQATAGPWALLGADSRRMAVEGSLVPGLPGQDNAFVPVVLPRHREQAADPGELVFVNTAGPEWLVRQASGDMLVAGRATELDTHVQVLGTFPEPVALGSGWQANSQFQALALPLGGPHYPSALLLMSRTFLGLSVLYCPLGDRGPCSLQPATFAMLPAEIQRNHVEALWSPAALWRVSGPGASTRAGSQASAASPISGHSLELVALAPHVGLVAFSVVVDCPAGTFGPMCQPCHPTCLECDGSGSSRCTACPAGLLYHAGSCVPGCPGNWWPDVTAAACRPCDGSCAGCTDGAACTACRPGLVFLSPDAQVPSLCGAACSPGEYAGPGRCAACHGSCSMCAGAATACQACAGGHRWEVPAPGPGATGACVPCPAGCASCTADRCLACQPGLVLTGPGACVASCPAGTWSNGETCQPCAVSCATCTGGGEAECGSCAAGLDLVEGTPGTGQGACMSHCGDGRYRDPGTSQCLPCHAACATCNGPDDRHCWRCRDAVLQDDQCLQDCAEGHVAVAGRCLPCHVSCRQCAGVRSTECLACPAGMLALPRDQRPGRCTPACPAGYGTEPGGCVACPGQCASCPAGGGTCEQCERGWLLAGPACVAACPAGSTPLGGMCFTCHAACGTCYGPGPDQCLTCGPGAPFLLAGRCHAACPAGTYATDPGSACVPCDGTCGACSGPGARQCTGCPEGRVLWQGECLAGCPAGYFAEAGTCAACHASCALCDDRASCRSCHGRDMVGPGGLCVGACPADGWAGCPDGGRCVACPGHCRACEAIGPACAMHCTACDPGYVLAAGECHVECPAGAFLPAGATECGPCADPCAGCAGAADRCTGCRPGLLLVPEEAQCRSACPAAMAPVGDMCVRCPAGCEQCAGPADGQHGCTLRPGELVHCPEAGSCDRCMAGLLLLPARPPDSRAACVPVCPEGHFTEAQDPGTCGRCHASCEGPCSGPEPGHCDRARESAGSRVGLAIGLAVGLLVLVLVLLLVLGLYLARRRRARARAPAGKAADDDDEDATMLNTIVELALPGAILVDVAAGFQPLGEQLGAGGQASVYAARVIGPGVVARLGCPDVVAVKRMRPEAMQPVHHALFQNEVALMWLLREHGHLVRMYGYSESPPAIVMERFDCDLQVLLYLEIHLSEVDLADLCRQWATGLEAMHAHGVAHRDLKPGNVFVNRRPAGGWSAAIGDLGTSVSLSAGRSSALVHSTPELNAMSVRYASPEVIAAFQRGVLLDRELFLPADIFSAAVMLQECLTRTAPWPGKDISQIMEAVVAGERSRGPAVSALAGDLIESALYAAPAERPSAALFRERCTGLHVFAGGMPGIQ
ncbi:serine/threonine protein kinase [Fonticula alba]|uniref:Serine/threonine protein kinase n=1 Tax=Fonticula alba TaxID=691883 RepID=A0A058Z174_FONAL|nr:serine/threonine protein kinase [Fonticula alba]KCV67980.1 serine/threonine protein kinase [Fonticula alba]|eukprot:XP_009497547.1 serine/threonine protein kinase [Fonticula alba]